ncbi:DNA replication protein DnaC [Clostridium tetanomorphum]|uniref:ATP-binding protein n=1 Tax=Clostridium tetanomorphum TaxID=1553 RepID=A0A923E8B5_CLOTT|nr:ATP-binding protein [Clostridium tetanomorphum]KAJ53045.1 DNA replication protein DnaC [Clostridium tetanomorphum DSM 665]MBC2398417.1 ATP-binding protein [Clostridium tetanomorphum]MBP1865570.1 DNA replication protein DnaC [Clostridium tetanomorphum]NRS86516.1 DNA replication protein DnaC [Clostridium tetanomorphum]NRZ95455.1 DNA replication protein DnaC [Clostridium tetanomorphum]
MIKGYQEEVLKIYEDIRNFEQESLVKRKDEINKKAPTIIDIEKKIAKLSLELSINILKNKENLEEYLKETKEKITDLKIKKSELLVANGYPIDFLEIHYNCTKCKDTGFIGPLKCECYKKNLIKVLYKNSELNYILKRDNFGNFNFQYFSPYKNPNEPESPRKNIEKIMNVVWSFIENFSSSDENLLFYGDSGTGKSFLANCVAKELLDKGHMVIYRTAVDLIRDLKEIKFNSEEYLEELLINCDLLIIDDLGTESLNEFSKMELFNLLNRKLLKRKKMLISTNFSIEALLKTYSERISSRLLGNFTLCKFYGDDIRVKINMNRKKQ